MDAPLGTEHCHECGLQLVIPPLNEQQKAVCPRCQYVLTTKHKNAIERTLIFSITAALFLTFSFFFEFLTFKSSGIERSISLITSVNVLLEYNYVLLAVIEVLTIFIIPSLILLALIYLSLFRLSNYPPPQGRKILVGLAKLLPWNMVEIFLIGVLVSLIKIVALADIDLGLAFYSFILFSLFMLAALLHFDQRELSVWLNEGKPIVDNKKLHQLATPLAAKHSVQRTWALLITSVVLYIPANVFPIMNTRLLGQEDPSTIIGGVILLWQHGSYPIAMIIFIASVLVPMSKIVILAWLNYTVQKNSNMMIKERIKLYRMAEFVGRWSMVDVFVVIIIVSLVQLGDTMMVLPGYATTAFSGVVVLTMLAAMSFDSTLIYNKNTYDQ